MGEYTDTSELQLVQAKERVPSLEEEEQWPGRRDCHLPLSLSVEEGGWPPPMAECDLLLTDPTASASP